MNTQTIFTEASMNTQEIIENLTLEEKAILLQGATTWTTHKIEAVGVPSIFLSDGPHGMRKQAGNEDHLGIGESIPATCFPTAATMANSWNTELGERLGRAIGEEARAMGVNVVLGPGLNIKRSPLCGRSFEYFSEDPHLAGKMAAAYTRGIQSTGVAACPKHFAVNSQETRRLSIDSVLDERTLREIYLTGFEIAVKEGGAKAIMSSYNKINGTYANENSHLLTEILRDEWGFDGFVVTDWGADNDHTEGVLAGSNLVMPAPGHATAIELIRAVRDGRIERGVLNKRLEELLGVIDILTRESTGADGEFDAVGHHALARECAADSIVLLENDGILPLKTTDRVTVIGDFAKRPRYQGAGSSQVNPTRLENLYDALVACGASITGYARGYDSSDPKANEALIAEAVDAARAADTVLLAVGLDELMESESMDRTHMDLGEGQRALIDAVCAASDRVVLVISGGAPFVMPERGLYRAAIHGYLGGQAGAAAMADAILGNINPSGKLSESWPNALSDTPCHDFFPGKERTAEYREGLFVGYRYYDTADVPVRYPFGHGLSYTKFEYSNLTVTKEGASFTVTNVGECYGAEVAELYVSQKSEAIHRPKKELKGFLKVYLAAGESRTVTVPFDDMTFRYFDTGRSAWQTEAGEYAVIIAASSADERLHATLTVDGVTPTPDGAPECYRTGRIKAVSDEDFSTLLGRELPESGHGSELYPNDAFCQLSYAKGGFGKLVYKILAHYKRKAEKKADGDITVLFIYNMPFRTLAKMSKGYVSGKMVDDLVLMFNGHFFRGAGRLIRDFFLNISDRRRLRRALKSRTALK